MTLIHGLKLNHKLLLLVISPLLVLAWFSGSQMLTSWELRSEAGKLTELAVLGKRVSNLVHELQKERGATAGFLGSKGEKFGPELARQRGLTDERAAELQQYLGQFDASVYNERLGTGLDKALQQLAQVNTKRGLVDKFELPLGDALKYYTGMNGRFLGLVSEMSKNSPDEKLSIMTAAYAAFLQSKERAGIERAVLSNTFARDAFGPGLFHKFLGLVTTQDNYMDVFLSLATDEHIQLLHETLQGEFIDETLRMRKLAKDKAASGGFGTDPVYWFKMQTGKINLLKKVEDRLANDLESAAESVRSGATTSLVTNASISLLGLVLTLLLGWVLTRSIFRQLGGEPAYIAEIADNIASGNLEMSLNDGGSQGTTGIYASIVAMRDKLREQIKADRQAARETLRIKTALDCVNTNVMVADAGFNIIYMNDAVQTMFSEAADDLREFIPGFDPDNLLGRNIDTFHRDPAHQRGLLGRLENTHMSEVTVGPRTFRIVANPVRDTSGERLGTAVEWDDLTEQLAMEAREQERLAEERVLAAENARIKNALDNVSSCVMMADTERNIIYMNKTVQELFRNAEQDIRKDLPDFDANTLMGTNIDGFHKDPHHQSRLLDALASRYESELIVGGRTMRIIANPVFDEKGERLGTAVEWSDRTDEVAVEKEVDTIVAAAGNGDLSQRIVTEGKTGFYRDLGEGINQLIGVVESALSDIANAMNTLASGDLTCPIERDYRGTYGEVKEGVNATIAKLQEIVGNLRDSSDVISTASQEISAGNTNLSSRTEQNASSLQETAASMEELTSTVRNNASNAQQANQIAGNARALAEKGGDVVGHAVQAMGEINNSSTRIAEIIGVIDEIAFQTNLLALNASVEAARAGEQGRGFAVVATEVRNLASRAAQAAKEIKELIQDSVSKVHSGSDLVNQSGETLAEIVDGVKKVADIISEITAASTEQSAGIDQVNQAVTTMDEGTQQNAALAEQTSAAAVSLNEKAREMDGLIAFFKVPGTKRAAKPTRQAAPIQPVARAMAPATSPSRKAPTPTAAPASNVTLDSAAVDEDEWEEF